MKRKKITVHDDTEETAEEEEKQAKKNAGKDPTPPGEHDKEPDEDIDPETRRPRMRW